MFKKLSVYALLGNVLSAVFFLSPAYPHCEIPCGIYGDRERVEMIEEHITTIEKSMDMIIKLSKEDNIDYNQLVRWVNNKEAHATHIQDIVFQYFMTQRIIPVDARSGAAWEKYNRELHLLHMLAIASMKSKQTTDLVYIKQMRELVSDFSTSYFGKMEEINKK